MMKNQLPKPSDRERGDYTERLVKRRFDWKYKRTPFSISSHFSVKKLYTWQLLIADYHSLSHTDVHKSAWVLSSLSLWGGLRCHRLTVLLQIPGRRECWGNVVCRGDSFWEGMLGLKIFLLQLADVKSLGLIKVLQMLLDRCHWDASWVSFVVGPTKNQPFLVA